MIESSVTKQPKIKGGILFLSSNILNGGTGVLAHKFQQEPVLKKFQGALSYIPVKRSADE
jgi:hypothetical protein